jgi:hypothetical protein
VTIRHVLQSIAKYCLYYVWLESLHSPFKLETGNCSLSLKKFPFGYICSAGHSGIGPELTPIPTRPGMDQGSDFVSDSRARRIRTQIPWEILSANCHEVTVTYLELGPVPAFGAPLRKLVPNSRFPDFTLLASLTVGESECLVPASVSSPFFAMRIIF